MILGFNGATTIKADLLTDIECARKAGFTALEIWKDKLLSALEAMDVGFLSAQFKKHSIVPVTINSVEQFTFCENFSEKREEFEFLARLGNELSVSSIIVVPGFTKEKLSKKEVVNETVKALLEFSRIAKAYRVKVGFEFLGFENCSVNNLDVASSIIELVNDENVGLVIDTFHFFVGGSSLEQLGRTSSEKIFMVHVNDLPHLNHTPTDRDRVMPNDGILPLKQFFSVLKSINYQGVVSVELFNETYWNSDPYEVTKKAYEKVSELL